MKPSWNTRADRRSTTAPAIGQARRHVLHGVVTAVTTASLFVLLAVTAAAPANAGKKVDSLFPADGAPSGVGGHFSTPRDLVVNLPSLPADAQDNWVYVADSANSRVQAFSPPVSPGGEYRFEFAIGRNVSVGQTSGDDSGAVGYGFERCVTALDCQGGTSTAAVGGFAGARGGMFANPQGIDIDQATGHFFVRDTGNRRVQEFTADGQFVKAWGMDVALPDGSAAFEVCTVAAECLAGDSSAAAGAFASSSEAAATGIAVVPAGPANVGNVVVADPGNRRLMEFDPAAVGASVFVRGWGWDVVPGAPAAVEICTIASGCQAGVAPVHSGEEPAERDAAGRFWGDRPSHVAIDSDGVVYANNRMYDPASTFGPALRRVDRFDSTAVTAGALVRPHLPPFGRGISATLTLLHALEVDPVSDRMYQSDNVGGVSVKSYDLSVEPPALTPDSPHLVGSGLTPNGLALNPSLGTGTLYVTSTSMSAHRVYAADDDGNTSPPDVSLDDVTDVGVNTATFAGTVNPGGFPTSYRFQYCQIPNADAPCPATAPGWTDVAPAQALGSGTDDVSVGPVTVDDLEANADYLVRIVLTRGFGNGDVASDAKPFRTLVAEPVVTTLPPNHRTATTATLAGTVNPSSQPTTYWFEYGETTEYGQTAPVPAGDAGSGGQTVRVSAPVEGLRPGTVYHYRLVAENDAGLASGDDIQFTTRPHAVEAGLGRAYELVSPSDKVSGVGAGQYLAGDLAAKASGFASTDGERYVVQSERGASLLDGSFGYANDYAFAERVGDVEGWKSHSPFTRPFYGNAQNRFARIAASSDDLSLSAWRGNGDSYLGMFPEVEALFPLQTRVPTLGDWQGRYEVFAPTTPAQGDPGDTAQLVSGNGNVAVMDAAAAASAEWAGGLTGNGDPYLDRSSPRQLAPYVNDVSAGLSDTFPGEGARAAVAVCANGTQLPARTEVSPGVFKHGTRPCPAPPPGRDAALISTEGASVLGNGGWSHRNVLSKDGSRIFFASPAGAAAPCAGTGTATTCPQQLYVRVRHGDGGVSTRWVSRTSVGGQDASLMAPVTFEGATPDGDKVFFASRAPLTADDPNSGCGAPCTTGTPSVASSDLYMYDFTDDGADDAGAGGLVRVSGGPTGAADCNAGNAASSTTGVGALRFVSDDGRRVYFTCAAPLPGVAAADNGTSTTPSGTTSTSATTNLYLYDASRPSGDRYAFVAQLPRTQSPMSGCASFGVDHRRQALGVHAEGHKLNAYGSSNCVRGTADGAVISFVTDGRLVPGDPDGTSGDVYVYDADARELTRASAPQGGAPGGSYPCDYDLDQTTGAITHVRALCHGDLGFGADGGESRSTLSVVTHPATAAERAVFFQSKSRLVGQDQDGEYDVYQWRAGELSLVTPGTRTGAYFKGTSTDGQDVFFMTRDALTWQDTDAVMDVYDARAGSSGIPMPAEPDPCKALGDGCQDAGPPPAPRYDRTTQPGGGNASPGARARLAVAAIGRRAARLAARRGVITVRARVNRAAVLRATARARVRTRGGRRGLRRVGADRARVAEAGRVKLSLRLSSKARRQLRVRRKLTVRVTVAATGARAVSRRVALRLPSPQSRRGSARRAAASASGKGR